MNQVCEVATIFIGFVIILFAFYLTADGLYTEPQGVGGFVYKEIEWAEQTQNILKENCGKKGSNRTPSMYYDHDKKQFYCIKYYDCDNEGGCRSKEWYYPTLLES